MQALEIERSPLTVCVEHLQQTAGPAASNENATALGTKLVTEGTLQSCARIIQRDLGLTLRLLRVANSAMFNLAGKTVMSVTHATMLMGTDALSQLVDTVPRHALPHPVRELAVLSHLTAVIARSLMSRMEPRYAEEAFITGLFRNLGELVFALEMPEAYTKILRGSQGQMAGLRATCRTQEKFDFDELGAGLLHNWSLYGSPVLAAQSTPEALLAQQGNPEAEIAQAAALGHLIAVGYFRCDLNEREKVMKGCWPALAKQFQMREPQVQEMVFRALDAMQSVMEQMGVKKDMLKLKEWVPEPELAIVAEAKVVSLPAGASMQTVLHAALEMGVDRVAWLTYADPDIRLVSSAGGWMPGEVDGLPGLIQPKKPPFLLAFAQRHDVYIDFSKDNRFKETPLYEHLHPIVYFVLPVLDGRKVKGCLYMDWMTRRDFAPESILPRLEAFRDYFSGNIPTG